MDSHADPRRSATRPVGTASGSNCRAAAGRRFGRPRPLLGYRPSTPERERRGPSHHPLAVEERPPPPRLAGIKKDVLSDMSSCPRNKLLDGRHAGLKPYIAGSANAPRIPRAALPLEDMSRRTSRLWTHERPCAGLERALWERGCRRPRFVSETCPAGHLFVGRTSEPVSAGLDPRISCRKCDGSRIGRARGRPALAALDEPAVEPWSSLVRRVRGVDRHAVSHTESALPTLRPSESASASACLRSSAGVHGLVPGTLKNSRGDLAIRGTTGAPARPRRAVHGLPRPPSRLARASDTTPRSPEPAVPDALTAADAACPCCAEGEG
ncbi:hypothetical protein SAMN02745121_07347 [Nannocystis exedens]|uniref:Uncharacterized protein n=1 Tax=Nannocystis exedens TaxID=54 RepID=A0A1I2GLE7_9BACT|nr:hypothetical protein NAEX_06687 [Nannocystis exedens]SFF17667.1 hypothetical protein SAMN02745121_07347 [Nannocystis exedens]